MHCLHLEALGERKENREDVCSLDDFGSAGFWPCVLQVVEEAEEWDTIAPSETNIKILFSVLIQGSSMMKTNFREQREETVIKRREGNTSWLNGYMEKQTLGKDVVGSTNFT